MSDVAISVENLSKLYRLGLRDETPDTLVGNLFSWLKAPAKNFKRLRSLTHFSPDESTEDILRALQNVSFEIKRGEVVGVIGRNGAGKSTLLKILSRITEPSSGRVVINGRVGSLLEVGTGFHPELTGRENIYMNGTILGMKKAEIDRKFNEIVDFSGVERFLDTPVKRYSSGMKVRLAFSVAAYLEPEILIVDEVLAVGDVDFQQKCLGKMQDVSNTGKTVLFVSHNMAAVQRLCSRGILLKHGKITEDGLSADVVSNYLSQLSQGSQDAFSLNNSERKNTGIFKLTNGYLSNEKGQKTENIISGESIEIIFIYESQNDLSDLTVKLTVYDESGIPVTSINTGLKGFSIHSTGHSGTFVCSIPKNPFAIGEYRIAVAIESYGKTFDLIPSALRFKVMDSLFFGTSRVPDRKFCKVYMDHEWNHDRNGD